MESSQLTGLLMLAAGAFAITASICDWDWFMNSRKARAWVKMIGRNGARWLYGGIGGFVCLMGLVFVIVAPGGNSPTPNTSVNESPMQEFNPASPASVVTAPDVAAAAPARFEPEKLNVPGSTTAESVTGESPDDADVSPTPVAEASSLETPAPQLEMPADAPTVAAPGGTDVGSEVTSQVEAGPAEMPADGAPLDLLALIDPARDAIRGNWAVEDGALVSPNSRPAILEIPVKPPAEYELTAVVEELQGTDSFNMGLIVGESGVTAVIAGQRGTYSGLNLVKGRLGKVNETRSPGPVLQPGRNTIVFRVTPSSLQVECNGKVVIQWTGASGDLSYGFEWKEGAADHLKIGSWDMRCRISELVLVAK